jgi:hypothetical protein
VRLRTLWVRLVAWYERSAAEYTAARRVLDDAWLPAHEPLTIEQIWEAFDAA